MPHNRHHQIFDILKAKNPNPKTELRYSSHFELLIAVMLSAQATDISVNKATDVLFKIANTPEQLLALGEKTLKKYISSIGLYNTKAKNVLATCRQLINQHNSIVPDTRADLMALPGVGRKTANVVLNTAFRQPTMAVDTHIFRVSHRLGLADAKTPDGVEQQLLQSIPEPFLMDAHHWLILHGRYICTARRPKCPQCPIQQLCPSTST